MKAYRVIFSGQGKVNGQKANASADAVYFDRVKMEAELSDLFMRFPKRAMADVTSVDAEEIDIANAPEGSTVYLDNLTPAVVTGWRLVKAGEIDRIQLEKEGGGEIVRKVGTAVYIIPPGAQREKVPFKVRGGCLRAIFSRRKKVVDFA